MHSKLNYFKNEFLLLNKISTEQIFKFSTVPLFISIDEVGRGCVAGSVVSCVSLWADPIFFNLNNDQQHKNDWLNLINDSKKLTEKKRQVCFNAIIKDFNLLYSTIKCGDAKQITSFTQLFENTNKLHYSGSEFETTTSKEAKQNLICLQFILGQATPFEIDTYNIWNAVQISIARALLELNKQIYNSYPNLVNYIPKATILMDGKHFIKVPNEFKNNLQVTVTQADGLFLSVGFSSIIAKVYRDTEMIALDKTFPIFGFAKHKGYGTATHLQAIQSHGICNLHRKSFLSNYINS